MKIRLLLLPTLLATALTASAQLVFDVSVSGTANSFDIDAATMIVEQENERRAALDPPEDPLPTATGAQLRDSALSLLVVRVSELWANYVKEAAARELREQNVKQLWEDATPAQRQAALDALTP